MADRAIDLGGSGGSPGGFGTFYGGISNAGTSRQSLAPPSSPSPSPVSPAGSATPAWFPARILVADGTVFSGGIVNASGGVITHGSQGIDPETVSTFAGEIYNGGVLSNDGTAIRISAIGQFGSGTPGGGIVNTGNILATAFSRRRSGIGAYGISAFLGGITNAGVISGDFGIRLDGRFRTSRAGSQISARSRL